MWNWSASRARGRPQVMLGHRRSSTSSATMWRKWANRRVQRYVSELVWLRRLHMEGLSAQTSAVYPLKVWVCDATHLSCGQAAWPQSSGGFMAPQKPKACNNGPRAGCMGAKRTDNWSANPPSLEDAVMICYCCYRVLHARGRPFIRICLTNGYV